MLIIIKKRYEEILPIFLLTPNSTICEIQYSLNFLLTIEIWCDTVSMLVPVNIWIPHESVE